MGESYIGHIPSQEIAEWQRQGQFAATDDIEKLREADAILICVPTPPHGQSRSGPESRHLISTTDCNGIAPRPARRPGEHDVSLGPPMTCCCPSSPKRRWTLAPITFWPTAPEREDPRQQGFFHDQYFPRWVGGCEPASQRVGLGPLPNGRSRGYRGFRRAKIAEACKILENTYRAVNIALVNELKVLCEPNGHRRFGGGDRSGQDQAIWVPGVLPRTWFGRALHSHRPLLPQLGGS